MRRGKKERRQNVFVHRFFFWFRKIIRQEKTQEIREREKKRKENMRVDSCGDDNIDGLFLFFSL